MRGSTEGAEALPAAPAGQTLLDAVARGDIQAVRQLRTKDDICAYSNQYSGWTPLLHAVSLAGRKATGGQQPPVPLDDRIAVVDELLSAPGIQATSLTDQGLSVLHIVATWDGQGQPQLAALARRVLAVATQQGLSLQQRDGIGGSGGTALHVAAAHNSSFLADLIQAGADVNAKKNCGGDTPLDVALYFASCEAVHQLLGCERTIVPDDILVRAVCRVPRE